MCYTYIAGIVKVQRRKQSSGITIGRNQVTYMSYIADLHIHSRYSRATSKEGTPEHLDLWARKKGISIVGTGTSRILSGGRSLGRGWNLRRTVFTD